MMTQYWLLGLLSSANLLKVGYDAPFFNTQPLTSYTGSFQYIFYLTLILKQTKMFALPERDAISDEK